MKGLHHQRQPSPFPILPKILYQYLLKPFICPMGTVYLTGKESDMLFSIQ